MFRLATNFYRLEFNYRALVVPQVYSGEHTVTNANTAPEIFGAFLASTPTCGIAESLAEVRDWFNQRGRVVRFSIFDQPIETNLHKTTAVIANAAGEVYLQTWRKVAGIWVRQPYRIQSVLPLTIMNPGLTIVNNKVSGNFVIGQEVDITFGFEICPTENFFGHNRTEIEELPFIVIPKRVLIEESVSLPVI